MLSHEDLLKRLKLAREQEKELVVSILHDLLEVESRGLYLARGYSSMYTFCMDELGYSESETMVRLNAMRLMQAVPTVAMKIESGSLSLTNAAAVGGQIRKEEKRRKESMPHLEKLALIESIENSSTRECERRLSHALPEIQEVAREKTKALRDEKTLIQFAADPELMRMLEKLKELLAHKNFEGRYDALFKELATIALKKLDPERSVKSRSVAPLNDGSPHGAPQVKSVRARTIRIAVKREAMRKAGGRCQYVDPTTNRRCESRYGLEFDHIVRFSDGGTSEIENIRVLCDAHNRGREKFRKTLRAPVMIYCA